MCSLRFEATNFNYICAVKSAGGLHMAKIKKEKAPREVKRNVPAIDISFLIFTIIFTLALCLIMTYVCTWALYLVQTEDEIMDFAGMMKYVDKNINFMVSYVVCGVVLWGTIGFVLSKVIIKFVKYIINYK